MFKEPPVALSKFVKIENQHPLIHAYQKHLITNKIRYLDRGRIRVKNEELLAIKVSPSLLPRALHLMNSFLILAESQGWSVTINKGYSSFETVINVDSESVVIELAEKLQMQKRSLVKGSDYFHDGQSWVPTGVLAFHITNCTFSGIRQKWSDSEKKRLEDQLKNFSSGIIAAAQQLKQKNAERAIREQQYQEEHQKRLAVESAKLEEEKRIKALETVAALWERSCKIKSFLDALEKHYINNDPENFKNEKLQSWLKWAQDYANKIDPLFAETKI